MAAKWIVQGKDFKMGNVGLHMELVGADTQIVKGGGWFYVDREEGILYLYKNSMDYGYCTKEEVIEAIRNTKFSKSWKGLKVKFTLNQQFDQRSDEVIIESL
jgi:hypothetical protein